MSTSPSAVTFMTHDEGALNVVRELGVDFAQGYLIGEPLPFEKFVATHVGEERSQWLGIPAVVADGPRPAFSHR